MEGAVQRAQLVLISLISAGALVFIWFTHEFPATLVHAQADDPPDVVINEVMWDGTEYIELFNTTTADISLSGWSLLRQRTADAVQVTLISFQEMDAIAASEYFFIERQEDATSVPADKVAPSLALVNTGELVVLKDSEAQTVDEANQFGPWFAGQNTDTGVAMERSDPALPGDEEDSWHDYAGEPIAGRFGTPGQENSEKINQPPEAVADVQPSSPTVGEVITFSAEDSTDPDEDELTYEWDFGDGQAASGVVVDHSYESPGVYVTVLTVSDGQESAQTELEVEIETAEYTNAVVVHEFLPNPVGSDTTGEFIELRNTGGSSADLSGWKLDDADGGSSPYIIPAGTTAGSGAILVFWRSETGIALNNDGDAARLISPDGHMQSSWTYDETAPEGQSFNYVSSASYPLSATPTPAQPNVITAPATTSTEEEDEGTNQTYSDEVLINEFLPNPTGSDTEGEFIELINTNSSEADLTGWKLDDEDGGSSPYTIPTGTTLAAGGIRSFSRPDTKLALNNDGDTVRLLDPAGKVRSTFTYEESVGAGQSYNRLENGQYVLSTTPTPGEKNIITAPEGDKENSSSSTGKVAGQTATTVALKDIRSQEEGSTLTTEGVVSVPPGVLGDQIFYIAGSGIQVYFSKAEFPYLEVGEKIRVTGELSSVQGEARLKLAAATDIASVAMEQAPQPHLVKTGEVNEEMEGSLVVVVGKVSRTSGSTFYVNDGSGEVKVYIKPSTEIQKPTMKKGTIVTIAGIVSQTSSGYRILPRFQDDVRLGAVAGLTSFPGTGGMLRHLPHNISALLLALSVIGAGYIIGEGILNRNSL